MENYDLELFHCDQYLSNIKYKRSSAITLRAAFADGRSAAGCALALLITKTDPFSVQSGSRSASTTG